MPHPEILNIVCVEDSEVDAALLAARLEAEWPNARLVRVETREQFQAALSPAPDLIISDWNLPQFSGREALEIARSVVPDTPVILLSGGLGEETAVEALKAGATDYVLKDRPQRLTAAIERAVREARLERERTMAAEHLLRVERLENIGILASVLAHDFNNALTPVVMAVSLLRAKHPDASDQRLYEVMETSARKGTGLAREIRQYIEQTASPALRIDAAASVVELSQVVAHGTAARVKVRHEGERSGLHVLIPPLHFHQVFLNLCANACEAMPEGGELSLRTAAEPLDGFEGVTPGTYFCLEVTDTGRGMTAEILDRIWTPFFTTKPPGHGHGLGLATVRSIVQKHRGLVQIESEPGRGTRARVWLPIAS